MASWAAFCCWLSESTATDVIHAGAHITVTAHCLEKLVYATPTLILKTLMTPAMVTSHAYVSSSTFVILLGCFELYYSIPVP